MASQNPKKRTDIPHHLIFHEVLPRLPAKPLIKFKSVAHEWNSDISSVEFSKTHLLYLSHHPSTSVLTLDNGALPFEAIEFEFDENHFLELDFNRHGINLKGPYFLISSCNGLVLLISYDQSVDNRVILPYELHFVNFCYVVYNPVLGADHFIEIPHPNHMFPLGDLGSNNYHFGFGYVSSKDDYYIVAVHSPHSTRVIAHEYSLRSQQWITSIKNITQVASRMDFRNIWCNNEIATFVEETLHWAIILGSRYHCILAYDLAASQEDKIKLMFLPRFAFDFYFGLCCLDGCLCAWSRNREANVVDMWMMREYGVWRSWTLLFRYRSNRIVCHDFICSIRPWMVLVFANQDELILADYSYRPPRFWNAVVVRKLEAVSYVPSLVSVFALISVPRE